MAKIHVFTCFDVEHDADLCAQLTRESHRPDSPFHIADCSSASEIAGAEGRAELRERIRRVDEVVVICGEHTDCAEHVSASLLIAREERKPYFLLWGRGERACRKPRAARSADGMYKWTWENVKSRIKAGSTVHRAF